MVYLAVTFALGSVLAVVGVRHYRKHRVVLSGCIFLSLGVVTLAGSLFGAVLSCSSNPLGYGFSSGERCENALTERVLANPATALVLMAAILVIPPGVGLLRYGLRWTSRTANPSRQSNRERP